MVPLVCPVCRIALPPNDEVCPRDGHRGRDVPWLDVPPSLRERFTVLEPFARGETGSLYLADEPETGRRGLLKLLDPVEGQSNADRQRLRRELIKQASLDRTGLAVPLSSGESDGVTWIFREWLDGVSLEVRLSRDGALPQAEAIVIAAQLASALDTLHRNGLLHRDVKPGHVLLQRTAQGLPRAILLDAGVGSPLVAHGAELVGTAGYIAPEQLLGNLVSFRSDLYSLGCVLYRMLTGRAAFSGESLEETLASQRFGELPALPPGLPAGLGALLQSSLAKEPQERPFSAQKLRRTLDPFLPDGTPMDKQPTTTFEKLPESTPAQAPQPSGTLRPPPPPLPGSGARVGGTVRPGAPSPTPPAAPPARDQTHPIDLDQLEQLEQLDELEDDAPAPPPRPLSAPPALPPQATARPKAPPPPRPPVVEEKTQPIRLEQILAIEDARRKGPTQPPPARPVTERPKPPSSAPATGPSKPPPPLATVPLPGIMPLPTASAGRTDPARPPYEREPTGATRSEAPPAREPTGATRSDASSMREPTGRTRSDAPPVREPTGRTRSDAPPVREPTGRTRSDAPPARGASGAVKPNATLLGLPSPLPGMSDAPPPLAGRAGIPLPDPKATLPLVGDTAEPADDTLPDDDEEGGDDELAAMPTTQIDAALLADLAEPGDLEVAPPTRAMATAKATLLGIGDDPMEPPPAVELGMHAGASSPTTSVTSERDFPTERLVPSDLASAARSVGRRKPREEVASSVAPGTAVARGDTRRTLMYASAALVGLGVLGFGASALLGGSDAELSAAGDPSATLAPASDPAPSAAAGSDESPLAEAPRPASEPAAPEPARAAEPGATVQPVETAPAAVAAVTVASTDEARPSERSGAEATATTTSEDKGEDRSSRRARSSESEDGERARSRDGDERTRRTSREDGKESERAARFAEARDLARSHYAAHRYREAAAAYEKAAHYDPAHPGTQAGLGAARLQLGDHQAAIQAYQRAVQLSPTTSGFHAALGRAYLAAGDKSRATAEYKKALSLDGNNEAARVALQQLGR